jgi:steroid 5-alpha reductase family enzyme
MFDLNAWILALGATLMFGLLGWIISLIRRDVSIVDSMWSLMFLVCALSYLSTTETLSPRGVLLLTLLTLWSVRLAAYITWRNWGEGEDYRYRRMRRNNSPNFEIKSIYIVFGLQATLAWLISLPLLAAVTGTTPLGILDILGVIAWLIGFTFESVGDYQLARFRARPENADRVLNSGLWRCTRHPNYFGDFCVWWGYFLIAVSAGGWWSIVSPLLMTFLLLRISGVALLEKDIAKRRPEYIDYMQRTNAFFPGRVSRSGRSR